MSMNLIKRSSLPAETVLDTFERARVGVRTDKKDLDNAHQARSHAKRFWLYMQADCPSATRGQDFACLNQLGKLRSYVALRSAN